MPRLAANISLMFTELPLVDRIAAAADCGFGGVEILRPYDEKPEVLAAALELARVECVLINTPFGGAEGGHSGLGAIPGAEAEFEAGFERALDWAEALSCRRIHVLAGTIAEGGQHDAHWRTFVRNLRRAAAEAAGQDAAIQIEPLNTQDFPGYFLTRQQQAHDIVAEVGAENLSVQMDLYHCQMAEGGLAERIRRYLDGVGHFQIAGVPGRHEPDHGEINYPFLLDLIDDLGFEGWVGAEYRPRGGTIDGLGWARRYGIG